MTIPHVHIFSYVGTSNFTSCTGHMTVRCGAGLLGDSPLREGLVSGFLLIFFSELGDKTFFIAVLLALKYPQKHRLVFAGAFGALAVMTVISVRPKAASGGTTVPHPGRNLVF